MSAAQRIAVVGGGIAGLAAAHRLIELGRQRQQQVDVMLVEASERLGGAIGTDERDGFVLEWGPDSFITEKPWALQLCERLGLTPRLVRTNDQHRRNFVVHAGKLHALPDGFLLMAPTRFWPLLQSQLFSWPGKLRMGLDLVLPRGAAVADESLGSFVTRRLGREALERVVQPLVGGIYTADPDQLSLAATMPRFIEMERKQRSIIKSMWAAASAAGKRGEQSGARWSLFVSLDRGMQGLVDALAAVLPRDNIHLGCPVRGLSRDQAWRLHTGKGDFDVDGVIVATPAPATAELIQGFDPLIARELGEIPYASSVTMSLAFRRSEVPADLDGFGFVVPHVEGREILACTYSSVKYPGRAPVDGVLLRVFIGGALQPEMLERDDPSLVGSARRELQALLGIGATPLFTDVHRHIRAMPQYRVGHLDRIARIDARLREHPGLQLAGNAYRGVGMPDCIHSGEQAAERLFAA